jgi:hypothetical protein
MDTQLQSELMNIKALEKEYNAVLKQYEEAYKNCNSKLSQVSDNTTATSFTSFNNRGYWGSAGLKEGSVSTQAECETMCASEANCTGATFNKDKNYCWARAGNGKLEVSVSVDGTSADVALLPDIKACMITLKSLNDRLLEINNQLTTAIDSSTPQQDAQQMENTNKSNQLHKYYAQLLAERLQMDKMVKDNQSIDAEYINQSLFVEQQNGSLRFWTIVACVLSIIVANQMRGKTTTFASVFWLLIMISLIVLSFSISNISGFTIWAILILIIILMKMGIIPSPSNEVSTA